MLKEQIIEKLEKLISEGAKFIKYLTPNYHEDVYGNNPNDGMDLDDEINKMEASDRMNTSYKAYRTSCLFFIEIIGGKETQFYLDFKTNSEKLDYHNITSSVEILKKLKEFVSEGWFTDIRNLISAEIFDDFIEMAAYLLSEDYKDPAAVIIGGVLEEHLRELCRNNDIETTFESRGKTKPKKADTMNADLAKENVYNKLVQKSVVAWLDLRNKAAHGEYTEYNNNQVRSMLDNVRDFIIKI